MLPYWVLGMLACFSSGAVIPVLQTRPFEDPPPSPAEANIQREAGDSTYIVEQPDPFLGRSVIIENPYEEYTDVVNGLPERKLIFEDGSVVDMPDRPLEKRTIPVEEVIYLPEGSSLVMPDGSVIQSPILVDVLPSERSSDEQIIIAQDTDNDPQDPSRVSNIQPRRNVAEQSESKLTVPIEDAGKPLHVSSGIINVYSDKSSPSQESAGQLQSDLSVQKQDTPVEQARVADLVDPLSVRNLKKRSVKARKEPFAILSDVPHYFSQLSRPKRTSSPAVDSVDENASQWHPRSLPKAQFVTKRDPVEESPASPRTYNARSGALPAPSVENPNPRSNEIPLSERDGTAYRYEYGANTAPSRTQDDYGNRRLAPRRIIYYATLPEIVRPYSPYSPGQSDPRTPYRAEPVPYDRYDLARSSHKFPRESRYDDPLLRNPPQGAIRDDRYRYRNPTSYTIIDAERAPLRAQYPQRPYPDIDTQSRYNRIPAPYQPTQAGPRPQSPYDQYRKTGGGVPPRLTVGPVPGRRDEPYRDYNPHQPAHWSMQIGTSLTVKDDGRPYNSGRRFYVQSQDQPQYNPATRFHRIEDDPRHRL